MQTSPAVRRTGAPFDSLSLFTFFWAVGILTHQAYQERFVLQWGHWHDIFLVVTAFAALLRPSSALRLAALAVAQIVVVCIDMPAVYNHWLLVALGNLTILIVLATRPGRRSDGTWDRMAMYHALAPPLRVVLLGTYAFALLAKLNRDFFDPVLSCAAETYPRLARRVSVLPTGEWTRVAAIWFTVGMEALLPVLLAIRQTRVVGVFVALVFHMMMGLSDYYDFSAAAAAFLVLFLPDDTPERLGRLAERHAVVGRTAAVCRWFAETPVALPLILAASYFVMNRIGDIDRPFLFTMRIWVVFTIVALLLLLLAMLDRTSEMRAPSSQLRTAWIGLGVERLRQLAQEPVVLLLVLTAGYIATAHLRAIRSPLYLVVQVLVLASVIVLLVVLFDRTRASSMSSHLRARRPVYLLGLLLVVINGCAPYLGLKTEHSFTMFSNLATEGQRWNHLIVPRAVKVFDMQDDIVQIVASSNPRFRDIIRYRRAMVFHEFRELMRQYPNSSVSYRRGGRRFDVARAGEDPILLERGNPLLTKILAFRMIRTQSVCLH